MAQPVRSVVLGVCLGLSMLACGQGDRQQPAAVELRFVRLPFQGGSTARATAPGGQVVSLEAPDDSLHPTAWEGPLRIAGAAGATCQATLSLITAAYGAAGAPYIV